MDMRRGLDFDDTVLPDDVLPLGYDNDPRPSYREQLKLSQEKLYKLEAQRDTLLAALKDIVSRPCCSVIGCGPDCPVERAFSAIKMVGASDGHK